MPVTNQFYTKNRATSVTALQVLSNLNALLAGNYVIKAGIYITGTAPVDGTDNDNIVLNVDGTLTSLRIPYGVPVGQVVYAYFNVQTTGAQVSLIVAGTGTVGSIYNTSLQAIPSGGFLGGQVI